MRLIIFLAFLAFLASTPAAAQVYKCTDASGNVSYGTTPCPDNDTKHTVMGSSLAATLPSVTQYYKCADKSGKFKYRLSACLNTENAISMRSVSGQERQNTLNKERFWWAQCGLTNITHSGPSVLGGFCETQLHYRDTTSREEKSLRVMYFVRDGVVKETSVCELYDLGSYERKVCSEAAYDLFIEHCDRASIPKEKKRYCDIASRSKPTKQ